MRKAGKALLGILLVVVVLVPACFVLVGIDKGTIPQILPRTNILHVDQTRTYTPYQNIAVSKYWIPIVYQQTPFFSFMFYNTTTNESGIAATFMISIGTLRAAKVIWGYDANFVGYWWAMVYSRHSWYSSNGQIDPSINVTIMLDVLVNA